MEEATALFRRAYEQHHDIQICIAELKRKGFTQTDTIKVIMEVSSISLVEADEIVRNSLAWKD
jgi:hypothetical protein